MAAVRQPKGRTCFRRSMQHSAQGPAEQRGGNGPKRPPDVAATHGRSTPRPWSAPNIAPKSGHVSTATIQGCSNRDANPNARHFRCAFRGRHRFGNRQFVRSHVRGARTSSHPATTDLRLASMELMPAASNLRSSASTPSLQANVASAPVIGISQRNRILSDASGTSKFSSAGPIG